MSNYRRYTKLANEYDYEIVSEDMQQSANNTLGYIEDLMERYEVNSVFELELYLCGFSKKDIEFFMDSENYKTKVLVEKYGKSREALWQKKKYLNNKLKENWKGFKK